MGQIITIHGGDADVTVDTIDATVGVHVTSNTFQQSCFHLTIACLSVPKKCQMSKSQQKSEPLRGLSLLKRKDGSETKNEVGRNGENLGDAAATNLRHEQ